MSLSETKILFVVTSHDKLGSTDQATGYHLSEVTHPYMVLNETGYTIDIASPQGGKAPVDPKSLDLEDPVNKTFWETHETRSKVDNTLLIDKVDPQDYLAVFFAGGSGTMWDFPHNKRIQNIVRTIYDKGGVVGAVCHGPAALVNVQLRDGKYLVEDKDVAAFSNDEEEESEQTDVMPFLLETKLKQRGAHYSKAKPGKAHIIVDERLVTGQNPASAKGVGEAISKMIVH